MAKKKKGIVGKIFAGIGIALLLAAVVAVICYFAVPSFKEWVNNSWTDIVNHFKKPAEETAEAMKMLFIKK